MWEKNKRPTVDCLSISWEKTWYVKSNSLQIQNAQLRATQDWLLQNNCGRKTVDWKLAYKWYATLNQIKLLISIKNFIKWRVENMIFSSISFFYSQYWNVSPQRAIVADLSSEIRKNVDIIKPRKLHHSDIITLLWANSGKLKNNLT